MWDWWDELNTPDAYKRDWYGEFVNQCSHTLLGLGGTLLFLCLWRELAGEMPYRGVAFFVVFAPYALIIEWAIQKWKPGDSWFDCFTLLLGALSVLAPFREVTVAGNVTLLRFDHRVALIIMAVWFLAVFLRVWKRYRAQHGTA